jgi:rhodanese-related sulfurtransferase
MNKSLISAILAAAAMAGIGAYWWYRHSGRLTWARVNGLIANKFPQVPQISVQALNTWLNAPHRVKPMLLDVRAHIEYQVSHLHHARWINSQEPVAQAMKGVPHDQSIVAYCSVGYRSSAYCARLMKDGFTNVHDLKGSIFQWANAGLPVYRHGTIAHHVHPYDRHWGQLLKRSLWSFHPPGK